MNSAERREFLLADLAAGFDQMSIELQPQQQSALIEYTLLLERWNHVHNLTAVRKAEQMISRHLLDSLSILPYLSSTNLIDVGSGAGLPGIPIAIARPELNCLMLDASSKKARFIQQAIVTLGVKNASVEHVRVEDFNRQVADCVVSRAFSAPVDIIRLCGHLCRPGGSMVFMMGHIDRQFETLPDDYKLQDVYEVSVAGTEATRHIAVCIRQS